MADKAMNRFDEINQGVTPLTDYFLIGYKASDGKPIRITLSELKELLQQ